MIESFRAFRGFKWAPAALVALVMLAPALALAAPKFPPLTGRVVDDAQILSPETEAKLTTELAALEAKTGHQLVVATLPSLQGYEIEDYGYQLGRTWALGRKGEDDGAILIVAPAERKVRIEVGYGLEPVLTDALSSLIIQRKILPAFKAGDLEKGVVDGTEAIAAQIGLPPEEAQAQAAAAAQAQADEGGAVLPMWTGPVLVIGVIVLWTIGTVMRAFAIGRGRQRRGLEPRGWGWILPLILMGLRDAGRGGGGGWSSGGGSSWGSSGGGGFSGGGGSFGGGGSSGSW